MLVNALLAAFFLHSTNENTFINIAVQGFYGRYGFVRVGAVGEYVVSVTEKSRKKRDPENLVGYHHWTYADEMSTNLETRGAASYMMCRRVGRDLYDFDDTEIRGAELDELRERLLKNNSFNSVSMSVHQRRMKRAAMLRQEKPMRGIGRKVPNLEVVESKPIISGLETQTHGLVKTTNKQDLSIQRYRKEVSERANERSEGDLKLFALFVASLLMAHSINRFTLGAGGSVPKEEPGKAPTGGTKRIEWKQQQRKQQQQQPEKETKHRQKQKTENRNDNDNDYCY